MFGELEGSAGTVAEGGLKPQLHFPDPKWKADDLKEVAGWFAISDNMLDDLDWLRGEITDFAAYNIQLLEETQLLSGDGADNNIDGLFNREIQTLGQGADSDADRIFKCRKLIATATGFQPDASSSTRPTTSHPPVQGRERPVLRWRFLHRPVRPGRHHAGSAAVGRQDRGHRSYRTRHRARRRFQGRRQGAAQGRPAHRIHQRACRLLHQ